MDAAQDLWCPVFILWGSHGIHHRPFWEPCLWADKKSSCKIVHISGKGGGGCTPECACSMVLVGQVDFSPHHIPYRPSSVRDQCCLVMLLQQDFQISTCLMARTVSPYEIDPKVIPTCPCMTTQVSLGLVLLFLKKSQCFAFLCSTSHWQNIVPKIMSEVGYFKLQQIALEHLCQLYDTVSLMSFLISNPGLISISVIPEAL